MLDWMAWTLPTAIFFVVIASLLAGMIAWELKSPSGERKGWLPIVTTRGDRLFIGLLSGAFIHLLVLGATDWSVWVATLITLVWIPVLLRWG